MIEKEQFKITVICEMTKNYKPKEVSFELTAKACSLVKDIENAQVQVLIVGKRMLYDNIIDDFSKYGADKVIIVNDDTLEEYSPELYKKAVSEILKKEKPQIVLFPATITGREIAPLVATELYTGLTADCTDLFITKDGVLEATRPTFGGKMNATILCKTLPQMATVRPMVFKLPKETYEKETKVDFNWVDTTKEIKNTKVLEIIPDLDNKKVDLSKAELIFAGGRGLKTKENFNKLIELAKLAGGTVGASRGAVDLGLAKQEIQIGQTGQTVNAKIYIAFGISGMAQHLAGINSCGTIIAINKDENAPIFKMSDYGIVGDAVQIIDTMITKLK